MDRGNQIMKYEKKRSAFLLAAVLMLTGLQMSGVTVKESYSGDGIRYRDNLQFAEYGGVL